jgi:HAMP domain-containing protein
LTFRTVEWIADAMPHLEELCVAYNDLSGVEDGLITGFCNLFFLDCSSCNLTSWKDQVQCFGKLPSLQHLMVNDNNIPDVSMANVDTSCFKNLRSLQLAGTSIASWQDLDGIRAFESLESLRFRNTPLTSSMGAGEARCITIARIPNLAFLNASPISSKERLEAERRYVSTVARELLLVASSAETNANKDEILALHPRFEELVDTHKESMAAPQTSLNGGLTVQPVNVTIRSMAAASCSIEPLQKRLPGGLKVGRLKTMCMRAFGLDTERQVLHFRAEVRYDTKSANARTKSPTLQPTFVYTSLSSLQDDPFPIELDDDEHTLSYYGVCDGADILMNEVDLVARQRD